MLLRLADQPAALLAGAPVLPLALHDAALLAWLALEGPTPRARLAALLWPGVDAEAARNSLRQRLFKLRKQLGDGVIAGSTTLALAPGVAHDLAGAATLLASLPDGIGGEFAAWLAQQRQQRSGQQRQRLQALADSAAAAQDWPAALAHAQALLALEPLAEEAHRRLMQLHHRRGDRAAALLAFDACEALLRQELGTKPEPATLALLRQIEEAGSPQPATAGTATAALLRPPRLIGRDGAWALLLQVLQEAKPLLVQGEAGMGKSRLLADFLQRQGDAAVCTGARPGDAAAPYATLLRWARALLQRGAAVAPAERQELARLLPEFDAASAAPAGVEDPARLAAAFEALLASAAAGGLRLVVIDDLHFADTASAEAFAALAAGGSRVAWVLATRPAEAPPGTRAAMELLRSDARLHTLTLPPLTLPQITELITSLALPGVDAATLAPRIAQHSGGNPMFVLETLKALPLDGSGPLPAAGGVLALIQQRLALLTADALKLARCAAVAGQDFSAELAEAVLGVRALDLADAWAELEAAQVLRDQAFAHDLIHEATLATVAPPLALALHGQVAAWLEPRGGSPARVAAHWLASTEPRRAVPALLQAGRQAMQALRKAEAAAALSRAAALLEQAGERGAAFDALALYFEDAAPVLDPESQRLIDWLRALAHTTVQRLAVALHHSQMLQRAGDFAACGRVAQQALQGEDTAAAPMIVMRLLSMSAAAYLQAGDAPAAVQASIAAMALAEASGDDEAITDGAAQLGGILEWAGRPLEAHPHHQRAFEMRKRGFGSPETHVVAALNCATNLVELGRPADALPLFEYAERLAASHGIDPAVEMPALPVHRARLALELGDFTQAVRRYGDALAMVEQRMPAALIGFEVTVVALWVRLGQWARAQQLARRALGRVAGANPLYAARAVQVAAEVEAGMAGHAGSLAALDEAEAVLGNTSLRVKRQIALTRCLWLPAEQGLAHARQLRAEVAAAGVPGFMLAADLRAAQAALRLGDAAAARAHARAALDAFASGVEPAGLYRAEVWLAAAQALRDGAVLDTAVRWVRETAEQRVPAEFRASFLERNATNRELLALAARGLGG